MTTLEVAAQINQRLPELMRDGSENRIQSIAGIIDAMKEMDTCEWKQDVNDGFFWDGKCGLCWVFMSGNPSENEFSFCPRCGKKIRIDEKGDQ